MIIKFEKIRQFFDSGLGFNDSYCLFPLALASYNIDDTDITVCIRRAERYLEIAFTFGNYRIDFDINYFNDYPERDKPATMCVDWYFYDSDCEYCRCEFSQDIFNTFSDKSKSFYLKNIDFFLRRKLKHIDVSNKLC